MIARGAAAFDLRDQPGSGAAGGLGFALATFAGAALRPGFPLRERITRDRVRAGEHFYPSIASRLSYDQWIAEGKMEPDAARERIEQILTAHDAEADAAATSQLSHDQLAALGEICGVDG